MTAGRAELEGDDVPSYQVGYVEPPITEDGSGRQVEVAGSAFLQVRVSPASGVDLSGEQPRETYAGREQLTAPGGQVITEAVRTGDFEAMLAWTIGLEERVPFGVTTFADPARLVVDVLHQPGGDGGSGGLEPGGTAGVDADATGSPVVLTDVRLGAHDGFDRIVLELAGEGEAGYRVGYTEGPRSQGSGQPVQVPGDAALGITLTNLLLPGDAPEGAQPWDGRESVRTERTATGKGLWPEGTPSTRYAIRLPDGEDGARTVVADTVGLPRFDYQGNAAVLDAMIGTLDDLDAGTEG